MKGLEKDTILLSSLQSWRIACLTPSNFLHEDHRCSGSSSAVLQNRHWLESSSILARCLLNHPCPVKNWMKYPRVGRPNFMTPAPLQGLGSHCLVWYAYGNCLLVIEWYEPLLTHSSFHRLSLEHIYTPIPGVWSGSIPAAPRGRPPCLPLECMTGMTPPSLPGLSPLRTRPVCTGTNPARTLHTYNVVVSIPCAHQKGSQGGWLVRLNRSH